MRNLALVAALLVAIAACGNGETAPPTEWEVAHTSTHWWMSAYVAPDGEQWIVGGTTDEGAILRSGGDGFTEVDHDSAVGLLNWVHGLPNGDLVMVGNDGAVLRGDGVTWTVDDPVTDQDLWGVWGATSDDIWAVGGDDAGGRATVLHDTGRGFEEVAIPELQRPGVDVFFKVWGSAPDDVYMVGQNGAVLHWNGTRLEEQLVGVSLDLIGIWGTGPDRVVAVGGRTNGAAAVWDGTEWRNPDLGRFPGINGVWLEGDTAYIVGDRGVTGTIDLITLETTLSYVETPVSIHAVAGAGKTLIAVGGDFSTGPAGPFLGQVILGER